MRVLDPEWMKDEHKTYWLHKFFSHKKQKKIPAIKGASNIFVPQTRPCSHIRWRSTVTRGKKENPPSSQSLTQYQMNVGCHSSTNYDDTSKSHMIVRNQVQKIFSRPISCSDSKQKYVASRGLFGNWLITRTYWYKSELHCYRVKGREATHTLDPVLGYRQRLEHEYLGRFISETQCCRTCLWQTSKREWRNP